MGMERYLIVMGFEFGRQAVSMAEVALLFVMQDFEPGELVQLAAG